MRGGHVRFWLCLRENIMNKQNKTKQNKTQKQKKNKQNKTKKKNKTKQTNKQNTEAGLSVL